MTMIPEHQASRVATSELRSSGRQSAPSDFTVGSEPTHVGCYERWKPALHFIFACLMCSAVAPAALAQQPSPRLIPFQGRLTDQQGRAYTNGQFTVVFRLYSQAVGGTPVNDWVERHQSVGVINGMINVFLGSITSLDPVDFSQVVHLGITIDADNNSSTSDPEMVPRQMIIPAFWAKNSEKLAGQDWTPIFGVNSPLGELPASKIQAEGITTDRIATNAITTDKIAPGAIKTSDIGEGQITVEKLAPSFQLDTVIPPGTIQAFGGNTIPSGWLLCAGNAVSSGQYPRLYLAIGKNWGAGVAASTNDFNLPDLRGFFLRGVSGTANQDPDRDSRTAASIGGNTGNAVGSIQADAFKSHTHPYQDRYHLTDPSADGSADQALADQVTADLSRTTGATGGSETRPKNAYVHYIIKY